MYFIFYYIVYKYMSYTSTEKSVSDRAMHNFLVSMWFYEYV